MTDRPSPLRRRLAAVPLRTRLLVILVAMLTLALAATGAASQALVRTYLVQEVDAQLADAARPLARQAVGQLLGLPSPEDTGLPSDYVVQLTPVDGSGARLLVPDASTAVPELPGAASDVARGAPLTVGSLDGRPERWRAVVLDVEGGGATVAVALPLSGAEATADRVAALVLAIGGVALLTCAGLGWLAVRRAFRPLEQVERTAAGIAAGDLTRRLPAGSERTEVGRLTASLNAMLARIETAFAERERAQERMRRFVADASHELRTPLSTVRGFAELYRQGAAREPAEVERAMTRIEGEAHRMGSLVDDLLLLARLDETAATPQTVPDETVARAPRDRVDLVVLAADAVADARARDPERPLRLTDLSGGTGPAPATVDGSDPHLRQVLTNLVANAVQHTPAGTPVEVAVGTVGGADTRAIVEVRDHGPGLSEQDASRVFERFYRTETSRTRARGGSGLGLSIVAAVVNGHGGTVSVLPTPGGGATFRVELPVG